jgi:hypothetical protein
MVALSDPHGSRLLGLDLLFRVGAGAGAAHPEVLRPTLTAWRGLVGCEDVSMPFKWRAVWPVSGRKPQTNRHFGFNTGKPIAIRVAATVIGGLPLAVFP